jgi:hypothetical protein
MIDFFSIFKSIFSSGRTSISQATEVKIKKDWATIKVALQQKSLAQLKQALITADRSLDNALKDIAQGETMGERLKNSVDRFDRYMYQDIWEAHKLRNNLVHEAGFEPPSFMLIENIDKIKNALISLGVRI